MTFHAGDRVIATAPGYADVLPGDTGCVLYTSCDDYAAVEWDRCVGGHDARPFALDPTEAVTGKMGYCTYHSNADMELLEDTDPTDLTFGQELEALL